MKSRKHLFQIAMFAVLAPLSSAVFAAEDEAEPGAEPGAIETPREKDEGITKFYAKTGVGYDTNAFQAQNQSYVDYYAGMLLGGVNPTIVPQRKSGFFVPYEAKVLSSKKLDGDTRLIGTMGVDGRYYPATDVSYASQYTFRVRGGPEMVLEREGNRENTFYFGAIATKHQETYVNHATGLPKTTIVSGTNISNRYNYLGIGVEGAYKHKTGHVSYGARAQYIQNAYDDPIVVAKLDNTYYKVAGDVGFHVAPQTRMTLNGRYAVRDYSKRYSHDLQGVYAVTNPLLKYSFDNAGAKIHHRLSQEWQLNAEYEWTKRVDHFVHYNDYTENLFGASVQYGQDRLKARLGVRHFNRNYPNAFAFDVLGQPLKTYGGNDVRLKVDWQQDTHTSFWTELISQNRATTDLRFAYGRKQIMAGVAWLY